jgi:lipid-A-disaccharide synthase-like uncharacterized protein
MVAVLGLSVWIVLGLQAPTAPTTPGANKFEMIIQRRKVMVEQIPSPQANSPPNSSQDIAFEYRFLNWPEMTDRHYSQAEFQQKIAEHSTIGVRGPLLRALNVSSYAQLVWIAVGLTGQILFSGRMIVQWLTSEKQKASVVPPMFWYMSLGGGIFLASYFIWRLDLIGVLGQTSGLVIYARNIRLLHKQRRAAQSSISSDSRSAG